MGMRKLLGHNKVGDITCQLPLQANQAHLEEINLLPIYVCIYNCTCVLGCETTDAKTWINTFPPLFSRLTSLLLFRCLSYQLLAITGHSSCSEGKSGPRRHVTISTEQFLSGTLFCLTLFLCSGTGSHGLQGVPSSPSFPSPLDPSGTVCVQHSGLFSWKPLLQPLIANILTSTPSM